MAKLIGKISFVVYSDDLGRLEIHSSRELEPEFEVLAAMLSGAERAVVKDATDKAASLAGRVLNYIAFPRKRIITNRGFGG